MATIITKNSGTASSVPTGAQLTAGELAVNTADKRLYTKNGGGTVVELGTNPSSLTLPNGTANGVPYLNASKVLTSGSALTFDGTNLGIGTSSPQGQLSLGSAASGQKGLTLDWTGAGGPYVVASFTADRGTGEVRNFAYTNFFQTWYANNSEKMRLDTSGNLGLGVTPSAWVGDRALQVNWGSISSGYEYSVNVSSVAYRDNATWKYLASSQAPARYEQISGAHKWFTAPSGTAGNAISFTQAMTLDASGNLLVGTTSSSPSDSNSTYYSIAGKAAVYNHATGTSSGQQFIGFTYAGTYIGSISQNGTTGVLYNLTSDYRLKNNPVPVTGAKEFINALQPKTWDWWDGSGKGVGFIAHEFMEVAKYSGNGTKDAVDDDGNPVYQSIQPSSSEVMANLVAYVQELRAEFDAYKAAHP